MNDELILNNYLMVLKSTIEVYIHGTLESSNEDVREVLKCGLDKTLIHQFDTYKLMESYDWYNTENVKNNAINKALDKLN